MERNITIYMFDSIKAASNLYNDLQQRIYPTCTFKNHIEDRKKQIGNDTVSFERILEYVRNDINMIPPDDLYEVILFFNSQIHPLFSSDSLEARAEYAKTLYDYLGITLLYEIDTTNARKAYVYLYETYIESFPIDKIKGQNFSVNIRSDDFLHFNDFLILMTKKIIDSKLYNDHDELTEEEEIIIETVRSENLQNVLLLEVIEDELKFLIKVFYPDERQDFIQTIYHACAFLKQAIKIRSKINIQQNPRVIIVDID